MATGPATAAMLLGKPGAAGDAALRARLLEGAAARPAAWPGPRSLMGAYQYRYNCSTGPWQNYENSNQFCCCGTRCWTKPLAVVRNTWFLSIHGAGTCQHSSPSSVLFLRSLTN